MNITIKKPFSVSETGKRIKSEESIYPDNGHASAKDRLFLICDGIGESSKAKIASSIASDSIRTYFNTFLDTEKIFDSTFIEKALQYTELQFDEYIRKNPSAKGMATMLCLLYFAPGGVFLTQAGDSRIYQFRDGKIIFKTKDNASKVSHLPAETYIFGIYDVQPNDEFFACTNGITEAWSDEDLCRLFSTNISSEAKINKIQEHCQNNAKDNYSAWLIPVHDISKVNFLKQMLLYSI